MCSFTLTSSVTLCTNSQPRILSILTLVFSLSLIYFFHLSCSFSLIFVVYTRLLTPEMNWKRRSSLKSSVFWDIAPYSLDMFLRSLCWLSTAGRLQVEQSLPLPIIVYNTKYEHEATKYNRCNHLHRVFCKMLSVASFQQFWSGSWNYVQKFLELLTFHLHRHRGRKASNGIEGEEQEMTIYKKNARTERRTKSWNERSEKLK